MLATNAELEAAAGRYTQALELVESVGSPLGADTRERFFDRYAGLYADVMIVAARELDADRVAALVADYAGYAGREGRAAAGQRLREYEQSLPTRGQDLTKEEIERNKAIAHVVSDARKRLTS
jgi:hypothetical protein